MWQMISVQGSRPICASPPTCERLKSGELRPGNARPSINRIAQEWGCAKTTAAKALNVLGLAGGVHSWGTIVTLEAERPASSE